MIVDKRVGKEIDQSGEAFLIIESQFLMALSSGLILSIEAGVLLASDR